MAVFEQRTQKVKLADLERFIIHSTLLEQKEKEGKQEEADLIKRISPFAWQNVNLLGRFEFQRQQKTINMAIFEQPPGKVSNIRFFRTLAIFEQPLRVAAIRFLVQEGKSLHRYLSRFAAMKLAQDRRYCHQCRYLLS